jgi:hypothetical protein
MAGRARLLCFGGREHCKYKCTTHPSGVSQSKQRPPQLFIHLGRTHTSLPFFPHSPSQALLLHEVAHTEAPAAISQVLLNHLNGFMACVTHTYTQCSERGSVSG